MNSMIHTDVLLCNYKYGKLLRKSHETCQAIYNAWLVKGQCHSFFQEITQMENQKTLKIKIVINENIP